MQKIWLIGLFISKSLLASQPFEKPTQFVLSLVRQSKATSWWGGTINWRDRILKPGAEEETALDGASFKISNRGGHTCNVYFQIDSDIAERSPLLNKKILHHDYGLDCNDKETNCQYRLVRKGCGSFGLLLTGVATVPASQLLESTNKS